MRPSPIASRQARPASARALGISLALGAALLAGCGGDDGPGEALVLRPAPAASGAPIELDLPLDDTGFFAFDRWPAACELLSDEEIEAVLPQVDGIVRTPEDAEITILGTGEEVTAIGADCEYALDIPDAGLGSTPLGPRILVRVQSAGTPEVVEQNFSSTGETKADVADADCYVKDPFPGVQCRRGALSFSVSTQFPHQDQDGQTWTDRYDVGGTTTTFTADNTDAPGVAEFGRAEVFRRNALDVTLAEVILARY